LLDKRQYFSWDLQMRNDIYRSVNIPTSFLKRHHLPIFETRSSRYTYRTYAWPITSSIVREPETIVSDYWLVYYDRTSKTIIARISYVHLSHLGRTPCLRSKRVFKHTLKIRFIQNVTIYLELVYIKYY